jgi:hypothetical protein
MFKMTFDGLVKRIRSGKGSVPSTDERDGWFAHKVNGKVVHFHVMTQEGAKALGASEVWAYEGEKYGAGYKSYRGTADAVAKEILGIEGLLLSA